MQKLAYLFLVALGIIGYGLAWGQPSADPLTAVCKEPLKKVYAIPNGAIWKQEKIRQETTPAGFTTVVGWINAATVRPCIADKDARIDIRRIRVIQHDMQTGRETVVQDVAPADNPLGFERSLFPRVPTWFVGKGPEAQYIDHLQDGALSIDLTRAPRRIYHGWTAPRSQALPGSTYVVEIEAKISGDARLQLGIDYWRNGSDPYNGYDDHCNGTNNCEGWISKWYGDTNGEFVTFRAPRSL